MQVESDIVPDVMGKERLQRLVVLILDVHNCQYNSSHRSTNLS